jgi:hypothetical protein
MVCFGNWHKCQCIDVQFERINYAPMFCTNIYSSSLLATNIPWPSLNSLMVKFWMPSSALSLHFGTVGLAISLLAAMPALNVLGVHHLSFLYKGHTLTILLDLLYPCWDLVVSHKPQCFNHGLCEVVNPFCHVVFSEVGLQL